MKNISNTLKFILIFLICQAAGLIGSFFTARAINDWYVLLYKPTFNPPNWLFGPVWFVLYTLMAISLFLIIRKKSLNKFSKDTVYIFGAHLIINAIWSILFFGLQSPLWGFIDILVLWILVIVLTLRFYKINKLAGWLFMPYFFWVSFATILNFYILVLNG